ncbi:uncharacterized protein LOC142227231 [Haematobia irritans]|uniref:uncharacterized protein LOC142227231 n=1 Tax=Haematobia irritans TaxID=7368 RepID=UPI003F4FB855
MDYANKRSWWSVVLILVVITTTTRQHQAGAASLNNGRDDLINNEEDARRIIGQFYNYVDVITGLKLDNMLKLTQSFVQQLLDSIPVNDHGNTAQMLKDYIQKSDNLRHHDGTVEEKEALLMELQQLIATIKSGLAKEEKEDIILRRGLLGMFELLARLSIEERKFNDKLSKAAVLLRARMSEEILDSHRELFDLLQGIQETQDIVVRERLFGRFKEIRYYHTSQ